MESLLAVPIRNLLALYLGTLMFGVSIYSRGADTQGAREPTWPTKEWQTSSPEEQGMDSKELAKLVEFGKTHSLDSLLVVRHGKIVTEAYCQCQDGRPRPSLEFGHFLAPKA
jgi:hypothetical protein